MIMGIYGIISGMLCCHYCFAGRFVGWLDTKRFSLGNWIYGLLELLTCFFMVLPILTVVRFVGLMGKKSLRVLSIALDDH
jgi:hypothetical protein